MRTRSSARNLFPPLDNPELTIRRRSRSDLTLLNNSEMAAEGNIDLPVPNLRTMDELCQPSLNVWGGLIALIAIQETNFRLKNYMIQQVQNSCQFHGLPGDDANKHLDKFLHVTQSIKVNGVTDEALRLYLFPHSLTHHATAWFDRLPRNSINTFEKMAKMFLGKYFTPSMVTKLRNEITNFRQRPDESLFKEWERYKLSIDQCLNHNMLPVTQIDTLYNSLTLRHRDTINAAAGGTFMKRCPEECYDLIENLTAHHNDWDTSAQRSESSSSITSSSDTEIAAMKVEIAKINKNLMRVLQPPLAILKTYMLQEPVKANDAILKNMQTNMTSLTNSNLELKNMFGQFMKMNTTSSSGSGTLPSNTITNPKEDLKGTTTKSVTAYQGPTIPTTTTSSSPVVERETEDLNFNISLADALILMPMFGPSIKSLLTNKDKLYELGRTPLNKHCSAVLLKKLPEQLGDPDKNLFPPLDNPELTIRIRSRSDPTLLNNSKMAAEGPGDLPVPDLRTMEELCQPSLNGQGGPISPISIQEMNFELKNDMIQQVKNSYQFHGLPGDDANKHLDKFMHVTQSIKVNGVTDDALRLYLFPHSLTHHATAWFDRGTFMKKCLEECYDLIENMTDHHNDWDTSAQRSESSSSITSSSSDTEIAALKAKMAEINKNLMRPPLAILKTYMLHEPIKANNAILKNMQTNMTFLTNLNLELKNMFSQFMKMNTASSSGLGTLPGNTITNPKEDLKGITTQSGTAYPGPTIPAASSSPAVERETEATKDIVHPTNNGSTEDVQPSVVQCESLNLNSEPVNSHIIEPVASLVSAPRPNLRPSIPYPSRLHDQKLRNKDNDQREKFFQILKDLIFNISFADALILMPKFGPSIKILLTNKDKLYELVRTPLNEHCSAVLLKKFPKKLGDPGKFLIRCDFPGMAECLALADLGASINLIPLSVWNKLSFPDLSPTCMTLELADRLISRPVGVAEDVFIKVGELTLCVGKEAITFNLDQISRYLANYNDITANRIDVIDMACEEYSKEVINFSDMIASENPTPYYNPIVSTTSPTLTPFRKSDFFLEEVDTFLALEDDPTSPEVDQSYVNTEGDILLLEAFLNDDPSLPPPNQGNYLPEVRKELKICEAKSDKSSIDEPPEVELNDLPLHLEYAFLEGDDKFPVIIAKYLSVEEKTALITEFEPVVQHQRRVNLKIHDVIKQEVLKLLDAGLIYPISDSPLVSLVHRVPKKGTDNSSLVNHNAYMASSSVPQIAYAQMDQQSSDYSPPEARLVVSVFQKGDDPIDAINHMMSFLTSVAGSSRPFTSGQGGAQGKQRVITCYNCKGKGHMSKQCTKPRKKRDAEWFKDKVLLVQAQANGQVLQEEELEFLADP
nr:reverse transcriptase domain-containing protein [Tanacetum cinerariifolium]